MTCGRAPEHQSCGEERSVRDFPIVRRFEKVRLDLRSGGEDANEENTDEQGHQRVGEDSLGVGVDRSGGDEDFTIIDLELDNGEGGGRVVVSSVRSPVEEEDGSGFGKGSEDGEGFGRGQDEESDFGGGGDESVLDHREDGDHGLDNLGEEHHERFSRE